MSPGEKFYVCTTNGRVLLSIENDEPGYDVSRDVFSDDYVNAVLLDGPKAGTACGVSKASLIPLVQES